MDRTFREIYRDSMYGGEGTTLTHCTAWFDGFLLITELYITHKVETGSDPEWKDTTQGHKVIHLIRVLGVNALGRAVKRAIAHHEAFHLDPMGLLRAQSCPVEDATTPG